MRKFWIWIQLLFKKEYATYKMFRWDNCSPYTFVENPQGMDIYNNQYIFQGDDNELIKLVHVIDINKKVVIKSIKIDLPSTCHMNNINIGGKFESKDKFPLLYISECKGDHRCFVVRLENDLSGYSIIQTICFNSSNHYGNCKHAFDWFLDNGYIYTHGIDQSETMEIIKFPQPAFTQDTVKYSDKHILDSFKIDNCHVYQGTKIINGNLYALFGFGNLECPTFLKIINLRKRCVEKNINITGLSELEALGQYEDGIIVVNCAYNPTYTFIKINNNE